MLFQRQPGYRRLFTRIVKILLWVCPVFASLAQSPSSPSELMQQVFDALERRDERALKALAITKSDFKKFIWPSLSHTVVGKLGVKADALYAISVKESDIGLALALKEYGGQKYKVIQLAALSAEPPTRRRRLRAFAGPTVTVSDEMGRVRIVHVTGGIVEFGGVYKVSTYSLAPDQQQ
jgi:hypothetical protein